jgi:hypothetical protein
MLSRISASSVRPLGAHPVREFLAFQDEGAAIRSSIRSTGPNTNVVMRAREAPKLAQAKRAIEDMLERVQRAQSSIGEPRPLTAKTGSSPLGSANDFSELRQFRLCRFAASPTFLHWTVLHTVPIERNLRRDI